MNLKSSLPTRTLFNVFSKVISSITYLILNVVSTRLLGAETYGNTQYIIWFAYTAWTVVNFAIPTTIIRYLALNSLDVLQQFIRKPIFYVVSSIIVILTTVITWYVFQEQTLLVLFLFIGIAGSFLVQSIFEGAFLNRQHFLTTCFSSAITLILFFPLVYHFGLTGYIVSTAILLTGYTVAGGLLINKYLQTYTPKKEISGATEKEIIRFALYTWLAAIVSIFVWQRMEIFFIKL